MAPSAKLTDELIASRKQRRPGRTRPHFPATTAAPAQRAQTTNQEYLLPVRFDDIEIPGLRPTIVYVDGLSTRPAKLAELIATKLGPRVREKFFPPEPDKLFVALDVETLAEQDAVCSIARSFMQCLIRMSVDERKLVAHLFSQGCQTQLPDNVHIEMDIVRRDLGITPTEVIECLRAMASLGFDYEVRTVADHEDDVLVVRWTDMRAYDEGSLVENFSFERATEVAVVMLDVGLGDDGCMQCADNCIESLDFSLLSTATTGPAT